MEMDLRKPVWTLGKTKDDVLKQMYYECLIHFKGNKAAAARELGVCRRTLQKIVHQYDLTEFINQHGIANKKNTMDKIEYNAMLRVQERYNVTMN